MKGPTGISPIKQNRTGNLSPMLKKLIYTGIVILISGLGFGFYLYNKPHQGIENEHPAFRLSAAALISEYDNNEETANTKYLGKIVEVTGVIAEKSRDEKGIINVTLQGPDLAGVGCQFDPKAQDELAVVKEGQEVVIKGICTGVLMDVVLVDCVFENNIQ
jgi:hypothetical protein